MSRAERTAGYTNRRQPRAYADRPECPRCGDPLPLDGRCDCAGDPDRDAQTGLAGMQPHALMIRLGPETRDAERDGLDSVLEVWV
jgi:hypothetical protein